MKRRTVAALAAIISMPVVVISYDETCARTTCSEVRSLCSYFVTTDKPDANGVLVVSKENFKLVWHLPAATREIGN